MNQIYNLQQTIYEEEQEILLLKKQLAHMEGVVKSHKQALERLLSIPEYSPYSKEKTSPQATQEELKVFEDTGNKRERITPENFKDLNIQIGDSVDIVVSGDEDFIEGVYEITGVDEEGVYCFLLLETNEWYYYNANDLGKDELYLIRKES